MAGHNGAQYSFTMFRYCAKYQHSKSQPATWQLNWLVPNLQLLCASILGLYEFIVIFTSFLATIKANNQPL